MPGSTFQTNPIDLSDLLADCHNGVIQLPDFQRSWVWDEDRIKSLIASISRAFPIGALMTLDTRGPVNFKPRPVEGAPNEAKATSPQSLLLDGQPADRLREARSVLVVASDRAGTRARRCVRRFHGGPAEAPAGSDRTGHREGRLHRRYSGRGR